MQSATTEEVLLIMRRRVAITHSAIAIFVLITIIRRTRFLAVCPNLKDLLGRPFSGKKTMHSMRRMQLLAVSTNIRRQSGDIFPMRYGSIHLERLPSIHDLNKLAILSRSWSQSINSLLAHNTSIKSKPNAYA
nr:hypothetical protein Iba_chr02fCG1810 [Ipomoea batatas]GME20744.1 hypothetical protein Iba_scaffold25959CG0130 [Ipomoea batatas]